MKETDKRASAGVILIIDDDEVDRMACRRMLMKERFSGFRIAEAGLALEGMRTIREVQPDVVLLDFRLPDDDGINMLRMMDLDADDAPAVVMMTGARDLEVAVEAMRLGARDYLVKDQDKNYLALLPEIIDHIMQERELGRQKRHADEALRIANQTLEQRVQERTAELEEANRALASEVELRRQTSAVLFEERERAMVTLASIADAVFVMDCEGRVVQMNPAAERLTGMSRAELTGQILCDRIQFLDEGNRRPVKISPGLSARAAAAEYLIMMRQDAEELTVAATGGAIYDAVGCQVGVVAVLRDVTRERTRTRRLMHQATHDSLTELPNRLLFTDRLSQYITHADRNDEKLAVVFLDLDGFKSVNDTFGHRIGDDLLQSVAGRLKECVREGDSLARLAGDEFTMIVSGKGADRGVQTLANKVIRELCTPFEIDGNQIRIGTSVGISIFPDDGASVTELMEKADAAMYQAKIQGGKAYRYYSAK